MPRPAVLPKPDVLPPSTAGTMIVRDLEFGPTGKISNQSAAALARPYTAEAIATLVGVMRDPASPVEQKRGAANDLISRAWGKPKETVELLESPEQLVTRAALAGFSGADLRDLLHALRSAPPAVDVTAGARSLSDPFGDTPKVPIVRQRAPTAAEGGETKAPPPPEGSEGAEAPDGST